MQQMPLYNFLTVTKLGQAQKKKMRIQCGLFNFLQRIIIILSDGRRVVRFRTGKWVEVLLLRNQSVDDTPRSSYVNTGQGVRSNAGPSLIWSKAEVT